ncbi:GMC family oxidoreductase [Hydrogenophaga sp.]|uniref:GMC family oxidoreductase n=1 Tax=Hydrogenophaga sp. TaxID=1904254 RepID=UPI0027165E9B|nr:GMC family oxidoreductase N-terminal domain-containing protein [Hydrogenophaga sp.]MDO9435859.1 GMC family oxidoreductase N-terminal domain-containing protein [Hydrogenophaga sp.]
MDIYDYIIVGGGSAGCVLARRLSDDPNHRVLLLEAGERGNGFWVRTPAGMAQLFLHKTLNWSYFTEPIPTMKGRRLYWPRGKMLGGSSSVNGMVYIRGHGRDFDHWASLGNTGWRYQDVLPYFKKMEHNENGGDAYRGTGGPVWVSDPAIRHPSSVDFVESARRTGIPFSDDLNGEVHDGVGFVQYNIRRGERQTSYIAYLEDVRHRPNLVIRTHSHVNRVVMKDNEATGVELMVRGHRHEIHAAREVIVSAGALNSPHLLMLSGIGDGSRLQSHGIDPIVNLPGVGRNLQDHFYVHCPVKSTPDSSYNRELHGVRKYMHGLRYLLRRDGYLALGASQAAAFVKSRPEEEYGDLQLTFKPMTFHYHANGKVEVDREPAFRASVCHLRPSSVGEVRLRSPNPTDAPAFIPNYLSHPDDVQAMLSGMHMVRKILSTGPLAARVVEELAPGKAVQTDEQLIDFMASQGNCAYHPVGTCKMGHDREAVVDARLRVHGVGRLRVIDASIMPRITAGNTNAPSMMIGEKGADMIIQDAVARRAFSA